MDTSEDAPKSALSEAERLREEREALASKIDDAERRKMRYVVTGLIVQFLSIELGAKLALVLTFLTPQGATVLIFILIPLIMVALMAHESGNQGKYEDAMKRIDTALDDAKKNAASSTK